MTNAATITARSSHAADAAAQIAAFTRGYSIEATRPSAADIEALPSVVARGTHVYLSAVAGRPMAETVATAVHLRATGLEPVPHIAVRNFASPPALDEFLVRLNGEADVRRALLIAGDSNMPAGHFRSAIEAIDGGLLARRGIVEIGVAGYPEGHPRLSQQELDRALADKANAAEEIGLKVHIVTQFCFDPAPILTWIHRIRDFGLEQPIRVGLAGPTNLSTLLRYAARCGVRASGQGLARQAGLVRQLFGMTAPDNLVRVLAETGSRLGEVKPHFFSFGGIGTTARWASMVAEGRIDLDTSTGFRLAQPPEGSESG